MSFFTDVKIALDHHPSLKWVDTLARKIGFVRLLHKVQDRRHKDEIKICVEGFQSFYDRHIEEFHELSEMLEDDFSKYTLERVLEFRKTFDRSVLKDVNIQPPYFQKDIFVPERDEVFVDGGAYVGDSVKSFVRDFAVGGVQEDICMGAG